MKITKKTRIFLTGCGGMLGQAMFEFLNPLTTICCTDIDVNENFLSYGDVRDYTQIRKKIIQFKPDIIFHLAALTDLEYCELHESEAWETNTYGTENIIRMANEMNIPMLYISSAGTFDGNQEFYKDDDLPNPINVYGKSKYAGELMVQRMVKKHYIFRAGWMMGGGPQKDKKFVNKLMKQILAGKKDLYVLSDKLGTPTYTVDLARNVLHVIQHGTYGLYNVVCEGSCSRYDFALEMLKILKRKDISLHEVTSEMFKKEYFAPRPYSEKLIPVKLKKNNLFLMRHWKVCLREYLQRYWPSGKLPIGDF